MSVPQIAGPTSRYNMNEVTTFVRKTITPEEAGDRLKILEAAQEALTQPGQVLTPRSKRELKELAEVFSKVDEEVLTTVKINRDDISQFYKIRFNQDPAQALIENFNASSTRITALSSNNIGGSQLAILKALESPPQDMQWYQAATYSQMNAILKTDFLDALKHAYIANVSLLSAATYLCREVSTYNKLLDLHSLSTGLYQDQIDFNRSCEMKVLDNAKDNQGFQSKIRDLLLCCGPRLDQPPVKFLEQCNELVTAEAEQTMALHKSITEASNKFLEKLKALETGIGDALQVITNAQKEVVKLMVTFDSVLNEKNSLAQRKQEFQTKQQEYQNTRNREIATTKVVRVERGRESFFLFWSSVWYSTHVVEADFGSADLYKEYVKLKGDADRIDNEVKRLEGELKQQLVKHGVAYQRNELTQAAASLAAALSAVKQLETAVRIRKSQSETQVRLIVDKLTKQKTNQAQIQSIADAVDYLSLLNDKLLSSHAYWVQSHKQVSALQLIRGEEALLLINVQKGLLEGTSVGRDAIEAALNPFQLQQEENPLIKSLPTISMMIEELSENQ